MGITTREYGPYAKGSRLTTAEMDENFNYLLDLATATGPTGPTGAAGPTGPTTNLYSATFFDTTTQPTGGTASANQVAINSTQASSGFTLAANTITVTNAGTYCFILNLQLSFTGGSSNLNVTVWYAVDDAIVPNSAFTFTTSSAQNDQTLACVTDTIALTAGQSLKFYWWSGSAGMRLLATAAATNPTRPLSPSVNLSLFNVG